MKPLLLSLLLACAAFSCSGPYYQILKPLSGVPGGCYCRYAEMATHYYNCRYSDLRDAGLSRRAATDSAVLLTHRLIAETQLNMTPENRRRFCDCLQLQQRGYYAF